MSHGQMARRRVLALGLGRIGLWLGPHTLTGGPQGDGPRHSRNGRLCIERRQQGSVRPGDEPGEGRARAYREDPGTRHRQAVAGQPADGDQPG
jgi:hypothetical protein